MDEADRMIDMGFEEDVRTIFSFFKVPFAACSLSSFYCFIVTVPNLMSFYQFSLILYRANDKLYSSRLQCQRKYKILHVLLL